MYYYYYVYLLFKHAVKVEASYAKDMNHGVVH